MAGGKFLRLKIRDVVSRNRPAPDVPSRAAPELYRTPIPPKSPKDAWLDEVCTYIQAGEASAHTLRSIADRHLVRKDVSQEEWSTELRLAIETHEARQFLLVSCAHILTATDARGILMAMFTTASNSQVIQYLSTILVVKSANVDAVHSHEATWASVLTVYIPQPVRGSLQANRPVPAGPESGWTSDLSLGFLPASLPQIVCAELASSFASLHQSLQLFQASIECSRLAHITESNPLFNHLDHQFPKWRAWAVWKPDQERLRHWGQLTDQQRAVFRDLMDCEGPDFRDSQHSTLRAGVPQHSGDYCFDSLVKGINLESADDAARLLDSLLKMFDTIISQGEQSITGFQGLFAQRPLEKSLIESLANIVEGSDANMSAAVFKIYGAQKRGGKVAQALAFLERTQESRGNPAWQNVAVSLRLALQEGLADAQDRLCQDVQEGRLPGVHVGQMRRIASAIQSAPALLASFGPQTRDFFNHLPTEKTLKVFEDIRGKAAAQTKTGRSPLVDLLDAFCLYRYGGRETPGFESFAVAECLIGFWEGPPDNPLREVAIRLAGNVSIPDEIRAVCLRGLEGTPPKVLKHAQGVLNKPTDESCRKFASILVSEGVDSRGENGSWHVLLQWLVMRRGLHMGAHICDVQDWFSFMETFRNVSKSWPQRSYPGDCILNHSFLQWTEDLGQYKNTLLELQTILKNSASLQYLFRPGGSQGSVRDALELLSSPEKRPPIEPLVKLLLTQAAGRFVSIELVITALHTIHEASQDGVRRCSWIGEMVTENTPAAELFATSWIAKPGTRENDRAAIDSVAHVFGIKTDLQPSELRARANAAADYLEGRAGKAVGNLKGLEAKRHALQRSEPEAVTAAMKRVGIKINDDENPTSVIPDAFVNTVGELKSGHFELFIPLPRMNEIQRQGMGLGTDTTGVVLYVQKTQGFKGKGVCVHLYPNKCGPTHNHSLWLGSGTPDDHTCDGKQNRSIYHLTRKLAAQIHRNGVGIDSIYAAAHQHIGEIGAVCIVCPTRLTSPLWRSTTCSKQCSMTWRRANLGVRMSELISDPGVVDLLLTTAYAASSAKVHQLLVGCPLNETVLLNTMNQMPAITTLQRGRNTGTSVRQLGRAVELLLSWTLHTYRGFLVSATGSFSICNTTGIKEFLLVNPEPGLQEAFLRCGTPSNVLFHGTSLDRLYAILREGLRMPTNTALQRHGAVHGQGLYLADEPSVALGYAGQWRGGWTNSSIQNARVVLGCEVAGQHTPSAPGIYVIQNESAVMVRYIFLFDPGVNAPLRASLVPQMTTAFADLRQISVHGSFWNLPGANS